jgi:hypothetical protein
LRCLVIELRETEIAALIREGLLASEARNDPNALRGALYDFFDCPPEPRRKRSLVARSSRTTTEAQPCCTFAVCQSRNWRIPVPPYLPMTIEVSAHRLSLRTGLRTNLACARRLFAVRFGCRLICADLPMAVFEPSGLSGHTRAKHPWALFHAVAKFADTRKGGG